MGIITIMITAFLAAFGPAVQGIRKSISAKEANRLATTLDSELSILRAGNEASEFATKFEKAYDWIEKSGGNDKGAMVLIYQYRGDPASVRDDGTLNPQTDKNKQTPGTDYVLQSVVRRLGDDKTITELKPGIVEGRVIYVRMNQLVFDGDVLKVAGENGAPGGMGDIIDPTEPRVATKSHNDYPEATILFEARFYVLKSNQYNYINSVFKLTDANGDGHPDDAGRPVFTQNMGVRR